MPARQNTQANQSGSFPVRYAQEGQFLAPENENFLERTLNAIQYMDSYQTAARDALEKGGSPLIAGLVAIGQRKNTRDTGKTYAKRMELAKWANTSGCTTAYGSAGRLASRVVGIRQRNLQTGEQIGNIQGTVGNYRR
jgi:hypothetical protein